MNANFENVFTRLSDLMRPYAAGLDCKADEAGRLYIDTHHIMKNKKPLFFGAVEIKKAYVSYHLMPVYVNPALLEGMSGDLKTRMQGKSCFNFRAVDEALFDELRALTQAGFEDYCRQGFCLSGRPDDG